MVGIFAKVFGVLLNFIYSFFKLKKTKKQVAFISRQSETPSVDFRYLIDEIKTNYPEYNVVVLCKMIPESLGGKIAYVGEMFRQMNALATSRVVVLDGYCILASMLNHKKELKIVQIWHALGSFKKFGKSILDMQGGKSSNVANALKMHNNYDLIATSGDKCVPHFAEAFGYKNESFIPIGIPRMDYLVSESENEKLKAKILGVYPKLDNGKKTILYVPTFRDTDEDILALRQATEALVDSVDFEKFNLVVKHHVVDTNKEEVYINGRQPQTGECFTGMDFMAVADFVVTDYSSIIYEALLKNLPIYIYCFDSDKYIDERGFYIDFWRDIPAVYSKEAKEICELIALNKTANADKINKFKKDYVNIKYPSITAEYGKLIDELARGVYDGRYNYKEV